MDQFELDLTGIFDMSRLLDLITKELVNFLKDSVGLLDKNNCLIHEIVSILIVDRSGQLVPIKSIPHFVEVVKSFSDRDQIYFNLNPYFTISKENKVKKATVINPKEIVSELRIKEGENNGELDTSVHILGNTNFIETLDKRSRKRMMSVLDKHPGADPRVVLKMINENGGDCDIVIKALSELSE